MKILHVCNHFYPNVGGIETYVKELSKNLIKFGHKSDVLCLDKKYKKHKLPEEETIDGIKVMRTGCVDLKFYKFAPQVLNYAKGYDIIHVHGVGFFSDLFSLAKRIHKKRLVLSTHGGIFHTKKIAFLKNLYFFAWSKRTLKNFDAVFAHSLNDRELFSKIVDAEKITFVPYSIYVKDYGVKARVDKNTMLFVGRIDKNKRIDRLIKTLSVITKSVGNAKLILVGGYLKDDKNLLSLAKTLGVEKNIISKGPKYGKELVKCYASSHIFVSAAEYEGFGISTLEAMASEKPVIVNDIKAFRNFVTNNKNGYIVDFENAEKTAETIIRVLRSNQLSVTKNAKDCAKGYDWSFGTKAALAAYSKLLKENGSR